MGGCPADWRDASAYAYLLESDRSRFAWEWLRRSPAYRSAWDNSDDKAATHFGLCRLESPDEGLAARPLWRADACKAVLTADAVPGDQDLFDFASLEHLASLFSHRGCEHVLVSNGSQDIRLDVVDGTLMNGPVHLKWHLSGISGLATPMRSLADLALISKNKRMPRRSLHRRAPRWIETLRVHDALANGASQRDMAAVLIGPHAAGPRWRIDVPYARLRIQRLVVEVRRLEHGGWASFLG